MQLELNLKMIQMKLESMLVEFQTVKADSVAIEEYRTQTIEPDFEHFDSDVDASVAIVKTTMEYES